MNINIFDLQIQMFQWYYFYSLVLSRVFWTNKRNVYIIAKSEKKIPGFFMNTKFKML